MTTFADPLDLTPSGPRCKNRLVKAAMVEGLCSMTSGGPNQLHYTLYRRWAESGYGMIISGNVNVDPTHLGTPGDLRIPTKALDAPATLAAWRHLSASMSTNDTLAILQLVHTGRQSVRCSGRPPWRAPLGPSPVRVSTNPSNWLAQIVEKVAFQIPKEMDESDIQRVVEQHVRGAKLAKDTSFHGIELHASHGYLLSSFLSPKTNQRQDRYGGSALKRLNILLEIIEAVRKECPRPFVVGVKLNSADYMEGGLTEKEALFHIEELTKQGGLDFIEISGGSYESLAFLEPDTVPQPTSRTARREAVFSSFCSQAKAAVQEAISNSSSTSDDDKATGPAIMCTGGFMTQAGIEQAMSEDGIDLIGLGRASAVDPELAGRLLATQRPTQAGTAEKGEKVNCVKYALTGGEWLKTLVPLKLVGGSLVTLWHQMQMQRLARGKEVELGRSFERLLLGELASSAFGQRVGMLSVATLAMVAAVMYR